MKEAPSYIMLGQVHAANLSFSCPNKYKWVSLISKCKVASDNYNNELLTNIEAVSYDNEVVIAPYNNHGLTRPKKASLTILRSASLRHL